MRIFGICILLAALLSPASDAAAAPAESRPVDSTPAKEELVRLETSLGDIVLKLNSARAPLTTANFKQYIKAGFYDGTIFHRVIKNFMIQGGGFTSDMKQKATRPAIRNEADNKLKNRKYSIAMARTNDPHSATAQFFINIKYNAFLDHRTPAGDGWGYAVFGEVIQGKDVVDRIAAVKTGGKSGHQDVPLEPVLIVKATFLDLPPKKS